jgi:hypothetical protein
MVLSHTSNSHTNGEELTTANQNSSGRCTSERFERQADRTHDNLGAGTAVPLSSKPIRCSWAASKAGHEVGVDLDEIGRLEPQDVGHDNRRRDSDAAART